MNILVIEDERSSAQMISDMLSDAGHRLFVASTPEDAFDIADTNELNLVISDWDLKGLVSGLDVCEEIKDEHSAVSTIIISGYPPEMIRESASKITPAVIFTKPLDLSLLKARVNQLSQASQV